MYFITNNPQGNYVVTADIGPDGNVTYGGSVSAAGTGNHGEDGGANAPDATFSGGIVVVHQDKNLLATVNTVSNTVVLFKIDPQNPTQLAMLGGPVPTEGEFPNSVVFNKAGDRLCVLNTGAVAGIACYSVSDSGLQNQGQSTRHFDLNQTTPANGPINTASQIIFTEDEQNLVVAIKGNPPARGYLAVWPLGTDDEHTPAAEFIRIPAPAPGGFPFSLIQIPGKNALLSADFAIGLDIWDFTQGVDRVNGSDRTTALAIPGEITSCWSAYSSKTGNFYIADPAVDVITEINVNNDLSPSIVTNYTIFAGGANIDTAIATVNGVDYLYTLLTNALGVGIMKLNGPGDANVTALVDFSVPVGRDNVTLTRNFMQGMAVYTKSN
ncbi:hypothetical protein OF83DRAFT_424985 [Amylostereum chailletii]|nr:hypothetical protein OF83DRAFT_424985 [Amylostereum chailletii]